MKSNNEKDSTARYLETFLVCGERAGIEDFEDGQPLGDHFFGGKHNQGKRYSCWVGGCGIGPAATLEEARERLFNYFRARLGDELTKLKSRTALVDAELNKLTDPATLLRFSTDSYYAEREAATEAK